MDKLHAFERYVTDNNTISSMLPLVCQRDLYTWDNCIYCVNIHNI